MGTSPQIEASSGRLKRSWLQTLCGLSLSVGGFLTLTCLALASALLRQLLMFWKLGLFAASSSLVSSLRLHGPTHSSKVVFSRGCGKSKDLWHGLQTHQHTDWKPERQKLRPAPLEFSHCIAASQRPQAWGHSIFPNNRHHVHDFL